MKLVLSALIGSGCVWFLPRVVPGIKVRDFKVSIKLILAIGILNLLIWGILGFVLKIFNVLTLGLLGLVLNGIILDLASDLVDGVEVDSHLSALKGSIVLTIAWSIFNFVLL